MTTAPLLETPTIPDAKPTGLFDGLTDGERIVLLMDPGPSISDASICRRRSRVPAIGVTQMLSYQETPTKLQFLSRACALMIGLPRLFIGMGDIAIGSLPRLELVGARNVGDHTNAIITAHLRPEQTRPVTIGELNREANKVVSLVFRVHVAS